MNDFFNNLLARHLGTYDTIQPRTPGRFEVGSSSGAIDSPDEDINSVISENNAPAGTINESDLMGSKKDDLPSSHLEISEQQNGTPDFHALPNRADKIHPFDEVLRDAEPPATEHALNEQASQQYEGQISIPSEKRDSLLNAAVSLDSVPTSQRQTNRQNAEHDPENEMDHRIRAMLQRLVGGS